MGYYNPVGTLHLFEIRFDSVPEVILLKDSPYNGHNFSRYLFTYKNSLFSLGGVGLFNSNSKLLKYDFNKNEWFETKISDLPNSPSGVISSWLDENRLFTCYVLLGEKENIVFGYIDMDNLKFHLINEINQLSVKDLHLGIDGLEIYQGEIFNVVEIHGIQDNCLYRLFNKKTGELLKVSFLKDRPCVNGASFVYTKDSTIFYRFENGTVDSAKIDETTIYDQKSFKEYVQAETPMENTSNQWWLIVSVLIILLGGVIYYFRLKRKTFDEDDGILKIVKTLSNRRGEVIERDEMNMLLGISNLSNESMKSTRSRMIKSINATGKIKISRVRNEKDKRYFDYLIV